MNKSLAFLILSILFTCLVVGVYGFWSGNLAGSMFEDQWSPRSYVPEDGECFVPPQGDPLYDEHYAKNVNAPNCTALKTQAEAEYIDAQTRDTIASTNKDLFYMVLFVLILLAIVGFFVYVIVKGGSAPSNPV